MEDLYNSLGFTKPNYIENPYGIKIYLGTKDKDDWCVEIPKELIQEVHRGYYRSRYKFDKNCVIYCVTEEEALNIAKKYTNWAKCINNPLPKDIQIIHYNQKGKQTNEKSNH